MPPITHQRTFTLGMVLIKRIHVNRCCAYGDARRKEGDVRAKATNLAAVAGANRIMGISSCCDASAAKWRRDGTAKIYIQNHVRLWNRPPCLSPVFVGGVMALLAAEASPLFDVVIEIYSWLS